MNVTTKAAPILLIVILASACWMAEPLPALAQLPAHSGGCHGHGNSTPDPKPRHDCCLTGHNAAIPQLARAQRPPIQQHCPDALVNTLSTAMTSLSARNASSIFSSESPGATPLRV
jgi:hypothetical protein